MYPISDLFKAFINRRDSEYLVKAEVETEEYGMKEIVDFSIESNLLTGDEFEIGTVIISQLIIKMRLKGDIPSNARIKPYIAFDTSALSWAESQFGWNDANLQWSGGASEWMPMGEYYVDSRTKDNDIWRFECLDKLIWSEKPYKSELTYPASMQAMWDEICTTLGYTYDSTVQINPTYMVHDKPVGYTMRKVLGWIAGANCASVRAGKNGQIQFKRYAASAATDIELTASDYINAKQTNALKTYTRFVVQYDDEQDLSYEAGTGSEDNTLYYSNPFMTQQMLNDLHANLNGFSYQPMQMDARGFPHLDVGDELGYEVYEGSTWDATVTPWQDTHMPWNGLVKYRTTIFFLKLRYGGGFGMALDAPSKSDQQSEFVVEGPLTQAVKQLNQTVVKQNRSYYGVTTSREDGLVIEREDGVSRLQLNSDIMDWTVQGESVLYLDAAAKKLKFSGTLEAADGVFSGRLEAGKIEGSEIWGSIMRGGAIYGSTISTRETGYPRIVMSDTSNLLSAEYSASRSITIDPNNYLSNPYPHLRFAADGYSGTIAHYGSSGLYIDANDVTFLSDVLMNYLLILSDTNSLKLGHRSLSDILEDFVYLFDYEAKITEIEIRLEALENA